MKKKKKDKTVTHDYYVYGQPLETNNAEKLSKQKKKTERWKRNLTIVSLTTIVVAIGLLLGDHYWNWFSKKEEVLVDRGILTYEYTNPSGNFKAFFPGAPHVIDTAAMGFPIVNYYAIDPATGDSYNVSHFRNVMAILGMDAMALLEVADKDLLRSLVDSSDVNRGEFVILKNEKTEGGSREIEARIMSGDEGVTTISDYRIIANGDQLMIVSVDGDEARAETYRNFMKWFSWLSMADNKDGYNVDLESLNEIVESKVVLEDGTEIEATPEVLEKLGI